MSIQNFDVMFNFMIRVISVIGFIIVLMIIGTTVYVYLSKRESNRNVRE